MYQAHLAATLLLLLAPAASASSAGPGGFDAARPWALGVRAAAWRAGYSAPGIGGQVQWRPAGRLGIEAFWNSFALPEAAVLRHDHVIGFHAYSPVVGGEGWMLAPEAGLCVDFRFQTDLAQAGPDSADIRFGLHGGLLTEARLSTLFSLGLRGTLTGYLGNGAQVDGWTATASPTLELRPVGQVTVTLNVRP